MTMTATTAMIATTIPPMAPPDKPWDELLALLAESSAAVWEAEAAEEPLLWDKLVTWVLLADALLRISDTEVAGLGATESVALLVGAEVVAEDEVFVLELVAVELELFVSEVELVELKLGVVSEDDVEDVSVEVEVVCVEVVEDSVSDVGVTRLRTVIVCVSSSVVPMRGIEWTVVKTLVLNCTSSSRGRRANKYFS